jgi:hypothetical protein
MTKRTAKKTTKPVSKKEAFEPNKMTFFVVATLSVVTLVLLAMIVTFS